MPDELANHQAVIAAGVGGVAGLGGAAVTALSENMTRKQVCATVISGLGFGTVATAGIADDAVTYAKLQNVSATSRILGRKTAAAGDAEECTLSEILDFIGSAAQGDILYRDASGWARLPAGTNGHYLKTQGAAANPTWAAVSGGTGNASTVILDSNYSLTTSFADVGIGFSLDANTDYTFEFIVFLTTNATTTGADIAVNGPASPTLLRYEQNTRSLSVTTSYDNNQANSTGPGATATPYYIRGTIRNGANSGTLALRAKCESGGSGTVLAGTHGRLVKE